MIVVQPKTQVALYPPDRCFFCTTEGRSRWVAQRGEEVTAAVVAHVRARRGLPVPAQDHTPASGSGPGWAGPPPDVFLELKVRGQRNHLNTGTCMWSCTSTQQTCSFTKARNHDTAHLYVRELAWHLAKGFDKKTRCVFEVWKFIFLKSGKWVAGGGGGSVIDSIWLEIHTEQVFEIKIEHVFWLNTGKNLLNLLVFICKILLCSKMYTGWIDTVLIQGECQATNVGWKILGNQTKA